jgi:hypothetical protein
MSRMETKPTEKSAEEIEQERRDEIVGKIRVTKPGVDLYDYSSKRAGKWFVFRRCERGEREIYSKLVEAGKRTDAVASLMGCVLYPEKDELAKELEQAPFTADGLADAIVAASGVYLDAISRKL